MKKKLVIESNEQIIKVVNSNILKLIMRNQKTKLNIDHRNMPESLTNLDTILAQNKNPIIGEYKEENDDTCFAEITRPEVSEADPQRTKI